MQFSTLIFFVFSLALTHAFKTGEDGYSGAFYTANAGYRLNPYYYGAIPFSRSFTTRPKFAPAYVETLTPTGANVLLTDPGHAPNSIPTPFQLGISTVVAVGPAAAAAGINEGDLVYTEKDCPLLKRVWLNKPTGEPSAYCRASATAQGTAAALGGTAVTDAWCQARGCSPLVADKCSWTDRGTDLRLTTAPYCILSTSDIKGIVTVASYGIDRNAGQGRLERPRDRWTNWRREEVNKDVLTGL